jgi:hypothetical protein
MLGGRTMNKRLLTVLITMVLIIAGACATKDKMTGQEATILALVLKHSYTDGGYTVVSPKARLLHMDTADSQEVAERKKYIRKHLQTEGVDTVKLVDQLFERNKKAVRLSIKSSPKEGYIVDYDGKYEKYFKKDGGGWEKWYKENPKAHGSTTVSLPICDEKSGYVLVYIGTQMHWLAGAGWIILYKYEKGELKELKQLMLWIS